MTRSLSLTRDRGAPTAPARQRLTPIEELDYLLDRPDEPNLILWEIHARGRLDRAALAKAVTVALGSDSGAGRRLAAGPRWGRRLYWQPIPVPGGAVRGAAGAVPDLLTVASWRDLGELEALRERLFARPIALEQGVMRVTLAAGPDHDAVIFQVHHIAFDGIAVLRVLSAISRAYRDHLGADPTPWPTVPAPRPSPGTPASLPGLTPLPGPASPLSPASLSDPGPLPDPGPEGEQCYIAPPPGGAMSHRTPWHADFGGRPLTRTARRLVTRVRTWPGTVTRIAPRAGDLDRPGYGFVLISDSVTRPAARSDGPRPTVNDLLVAALCLTIERWNADHGRASGQISVTVPVNGRVAGPHWEGPGNLSRLIRVVTSPAQRAEPDTLLAAVAAQTRAAREQGRVGGTDALSRLLATAWAPVPVKRRTARLIRGLAAPVITDTSMVSNLGVLADPPTFNGGGTEHVWMASPCPLPRGLSVGALTIAGRLYLSVRYRLALMDHAAAEDFTARLRAAIAGLAGPEAP